MVFGLKPGSLLFDRNSWAKSPRSDNFIILDIKADVHGVSENEALLKLRAEERDWSVSNGISVAKSEYVADGLGRPFVHRVSENWSG